MRWRWLFLFVRKGPFSKTEITWKTFNFCSVSVVFLTFNLWASWDPLQCAQEQSISWRSQRIFDKSVFDGDTFHSWVQCGVTGRSLLTSPSVDTVFCRERQGHTNGLRRKRQKYTFPLQLLQDKCEKPHDDRIWLFHVYESRRFIFDFLFSQFTSLFVCFFIYIQSIFKPCLSWVTNNKWSYYHT